MKTFEEYLQEKCGATYDFRDMLNNIAEEEMLEEIHNFSKEVAREALKNAADNAYLIESIQNSAVYDTIDKSSILNEKNIPEI